MQSPVMPVLVYGLEVVLQKQKHQDTFEWFNKRFLKLILSLPVNVADPAVYILTGILPDEALLHKRVLTLFGNIFRLPQTSIEHQLAKRQFIGVGIGGQGAKPLNNLGGGGGNKPFAPSQ